MESGTTLRSSRGWIFMLGFIGTLILICIVVAPAIVGTQLRLTTEGPTTTPTLAPTQRPTTKTPTTKTPTKNPTPPT